MTEETMSAAAAARHRPNPCSASKTCPPSRCARCSTPASTSATRPSAGTRRCAPFIYGARNGIHIIDLDQTARLFKRAFDFVVETVARGGHVLFVGTKRQAQDIVQEEAARSGQFFVTNRWLGGTLTNFRTIKVGLDRLRTLERMKEDGTYRRAPEEGSLAPRQGARAPREVRRRPQGHERPARGDLRHRPAPRDIAVSEANKLEHPDRRASPTPTAIRT